MTNFTIILLGLMVLYLSGQLVAIWRFIIILCLTDRLKNKFLTKKYFPKNSRDLNNSDCPKVTVILTLRGDDSTLSSCIHGLLYQDYPNYNIKIIIDSDTDPAWSIVNQIIKNNPSHISVNVSSLIDRLETCSLKCSALIQAVSELDQECEIIAFTDGDIDIPSYWLRHLVIPLANPKISVTTGNRWYSPTGKQWGSLVRMLWCAYHAVPFMHLLGMVWGGSFAIRKKTLDEIKILSTWSKVFSDDCSLSALTKAYKLRVYFVPSLLMVNREECELNNCINWISRQYLTFSLTLPYYWLCLFSHVLFYGSTPLLVFAMFIYALILSDIYLAFWSINIIILYVMMMFLTFCYFNHIVWKHLQYSHNLKPPLYSRITLLKILLLQFLMPIIQLITFLKTALMQNVTWRGVKYRITRDRRVHLIEYKPYSSHIKSEKFSSKNKRIDSIF